MQSYTVATVVLWALCVLPCAEGVRRKIQKKVNSDTESEGIQLRKECPRDDPVPGSTGWRWLLSKCEDYNAVDCRILPGGPGSDRLSNGKKGCCCPTGARWSSKWGACVSCLEDQYDESRAKVFMQYARAAFCKKEAVQDWSCGPMCDAAQVVPGKVRFIRQEEGKVQGFVAQVPDGEDTGLASAVQCVVAFRGSKNIENWIKNFVGLGQVHWPWHGPLNRSNDTFGFNYTRLGDWCDGCRVHAGFALAYELLREDLFYAIQNLSCTNIQFAGHSLGGAITTLASMEVRQIPGLTVGTTYTFGSPRVGNDAFVEAYLQAAQKDGVSPAMWRIVYNNDPVPHLPPQTINSSIPGLILGYYHVPTEVEYSYGNVDYRVCISTDHQREDPLCSFATPRWRLINLDHMNYLNESFLSSRFPESCGA